LQKPFCSDCYWREINATVRGGGGVAVETRNGLCERLRKYKLTYYCTTLLYAIVYLYTKRSPHREVPGRRILRHDFKKKNLYILIYIIYDISREIRVKYIVHLYVREEDDFAKN